MQAVPSVHRGKLEKLYDKGYITGFTTGFTIATFMCAIAYSYVYILKE